MMVKNCFGTEIDLSRYSKVILIERSDDWRGSCSKYVIGVESEPVGTFDGHPIANQAILEEFDDFEAAKLAKIKYETCLQNISLTDR